MKGKVLGFQEEGGAVAGEDGERYSFSRDAWKGAGEPVPGMDVDFVAAEGIAGDIYPIANTNTAPVKAATAPPTSSLAVVSLFFGILGIFIFGSLIAVICGHVARSRMKANPGTESGEGMALAGLILGYTGLALWGLWLFFFMIGALVAVAGL